jgi:parvulin-like peptidyl-prolyl isomerase
MSQRPDLAAADGDMLDLIKKNGMGESSTLSRAQKPDTNSTPTQQNVSTQPANDPQSNGIPAASIWVTVNGAPILYEEVESACKGPLRSLDTLPESVRQRKRTEIITSTTNQLIDREVVLQDMFETLSQNKGTKKFLDAIQKEAKTQFEKTYLHNLKETQKLDSDEKVREFFTNNGVSLDLFRRQIERQFMFTEYVRARLKPIFDRVGHLEIQEYFDSHPEEFRVEDSVEWQDICIETAKNYSRDAALRLAESLAVRARNGENFVQLAQQFDNGVSRYRENALGVGTKRGSIRPVEVEEPLFRLAEGQVGPVVEIPSGFHVFRVLKRVYAGQMKFDDKVQKEIKNKLKSEIFQREMKDYIKRLRDRASVEWSTPPK